MTTIILSTGTILEELPQDASGASQVVVQGSDAEMSDAEWAEFCALSRAAHKADWAAKVVADKLAWAKQVAS